MEQKKIAGKIILVIAILLTWGLLAIPIIIYYLPLPQEEPEPQEQNITTLANGTDGESAYFSCRESFFREPTFNICVPHCPSWRQEPAGISILIDVVVFLAYFTGFVAAILILTISFVQRDTMFTFPNTLVVYMTTVYLIQNFFYVTTFFNRAKLYCSSESWFATFGQMTPFCVISGIVQVYSTLSVSLWWLMLAATLFWKIVFPLHSRSFQTTVKWTYIHVGCALVGIVIPFIPVISLMSGYAVRVKKTGGNFVSGGLGFTNVRFPPQPCNGNDKAIVFYTTILPTNIFLAIGITLTIFILRAVHKQIGSTRDKNLSKTLKFGSSEFKIMLIICYYIVSTVINLTAFADFSRNADLFQVRLSKYFTCEQFGHNPEDPCDRKQFEETVSTTLVILSYGFHGTLPLVNLVFSCNINDLKMKCQKNSVRSQAKKNTSTSVIS